MLTHQHYWKSKGSGTLEGLPCDLLIVKADWYYAPNERNETYDVDTNNR